MEELMQCMKCGAWLPRSKLELMKTGTRRRVCNHCKWLYYVKPARERRIIRESEQRTPLLLGGGARGGGDKQGLKP